MLHREPRITTESDHVETFRGVVQLSGFVDSDKSRNRALEVARSVDGVREVRDSMDVRHAGG